MHPAILIAAAAEFAARAHVNDRRKGDAREPYITIWPKWRRCWRLQATAATLF